MTTDVVTDFVSYSDENKSEESDYSESESNESSSSDRVISNDRLVSNESSSKVSLKLLQKTQEDLERSYTCPLTLDYMVYPIKASDGYIYERYIILQWYFENNTSPMTRELLTPNFEEQEELQQEIRTYLQEQNIPLPRLPLSGLLLWRKVQKRQILWRIETERLNRELEIDHSNSNSNSNRQRRNRRNIRSVRMINSETRQHTIRCLQCYRMVQLQNFDSNPFQICPCGRLLFNLRSDHNLLNNNSQENVVGQRSDRNRSSSCSLQ